MLKKTLNKSFIISKKLQIRYIVSKKFSSDLKNEKKKIIDDDFDDEFYEIPRKPLTRLGIVRRLIFWGLFSGISYDYYNKSDKDRKEHTIYQYLYPHVIKFEKTTTNLYELFTLPPVDKLLPKQSIKHKKLTLVLDFDGLMFKVQHTYGRGYKVFARPGLREFMAELERKFEVIIWSEEDNMFVNQAIFEYYAQFNEVDLKTFKVDLTNEMDMMQLMQATWMPKIMATFGRESMKFKKNKKRDRLGIFK